LSTLGKSALILLLGLLWASESVLGKITLESNASVFEFPLILNIGTVISLTSLMLLARFRRTMLTWNKGQFGWMLGVALSLVFIPYCVLYLSLRVLSPAETSLITSLTPVFSILIGAMLFRVSVNAKSVLAIMLGIMGVMLMIVPRLDGGTGKADLIVYGLMLIVPLSYAVSGYLVKKCSDMGASYLQLLFVTNLVSGLLFLTLNGGLPVLTGGESIVLYMGGILINIAAIALMLFISGRMSPAALSFSNYATLMFSFILSILVFFQELSAALMVAVVLIVISSILIQEKNDAGVCDQ
jgi:drug/metabolite transporter (DMT)-like permease